MKQQWIYWIAATKVDSTGTNVHIIRGSLMRSGNRRFGGTVAATLALAGIPATATAAHARQVVNVPCSTPSLISAINTANTAGSGTLLLASHCTYLLTTSNGVGRGPDGLPLITGNLNLIGGNSTTIARSSTAVAFRIVEVASGAVLGLRNLFISGGNADATIPTNDTGGGILNSRGTVLLNHVTLTGNTADSGAGFSNDSGRVDVANTLVQNNTTRAGGGGGGGFYNDGSLTIEFSILRANHANTTGGGIYNGQGGRAQFVNVTADANTAGTNGGAFFNATDGRLTLIRTLVNRNIATSGGGIFNAAIVGRVSLVTSIVTTNAPNNCAPPGSVPGCIG
ncbi:hypothetical protein [Actinoallomurus bryophytorum]|nr:hypothetical protein [Actinoallomurus bryophytorum]